MVRTTSLSLGVLQKQEHPGKKGILPGSYEDPSVQSGAFLCISIPPRRTGETTTRLE
jgi:hypothetical protein